jgi:hypothetical protein
MDPLIKVHGRMESIMAKANLHGLTVPSMRVSINTVKRRDMDYSTTLPKSFIRAAGIMVFKMVKVPYMLPMAMF